MPTFTYHINNHRSNHHTVGLPFLPESSADPIASESFPFQGIFYNNLGKLIGEDNSYNWWSSYETTKENYIEWNKFRTVYTVLNSNSAQWQNIESVYTTYNSLSDNLNSAYNTFYENKNYWFYKIDGYQKYDNISQEDTKQKNFSTDYVYLDESNNFVWDLSANQVAFYVIDNDLLFSDFTGAKKGGLYDLLLISDASCDTSLNIDFDSNKFKFYNDVNTFSYPDVHGIKLKFIYDGEFLVCLKKNIYNITPPEKNTYYAGTGIKLYNNNVEVNPITVDVGETIYNNFGESLTINGIEPYLPSNSIKIDGKTYNRNFIFTFTATNALCAESPYGQLGSEDRILFVNPNITVIDSLSSGNSVEIDKCESYQNLEIITKAYGYISKLLINDEEITDFIFNDSGYDNHEMGHSISEAPKYDSPRTKEIFANFEYSAPILHNENLALWLDAMDYSSVNFTINNGNKNITNLSSKVPNSNINFTSTVGSNIIYDTSPKQSFIYNSSSTHFRNIIIPNGIDFVTFTLLTPLDYSNNIRWLWSNGGYGIFKIAGEYSLGIGTNFEYHKYTYGIENKNNPICIATRYLKDHNVQDIYINNNPSSKLMSISYTSINSYMSIGGIGNPLTNLSNYKLHELIIYNGYKNDSEIAEISDYIVDKWKFI